MGVIEHIQVKKMSNTDPTKTNGGGGIRCPRGVISRAS